MDVVGILGGTFDPVHLGHIHMAQEARLCLGLSEVRLLPCYQPPHRELPCLTADQRLHLLRLATSGIQGLVVDDREFKRQGPSYTIDTLCELRQCLGNRVSLVLLMGADAYSGLLSWHRWDALLNVAHIAIFQRPGCALPAQGVLADLINQSDIGQLHQNIAGSVVVLNQQQMDISATAIRQQLAAGVLSRYLSPAVRNYISQNQLYGFNEKQINDY